jgi:sugar transferase
LIGWVIDLNYADLVWDHDENAHAEYMNNLAPIVLFTYNRLDHTKQTVEALRANLYAKESVLYIYSDAPKTEAAAEVVQVVRDYLHTIDGFREVHIVLREENWGLARNIMDGVTQIVNQYGKIIVLEDDIVTSRYFLKYMNDALEIYKDAPQVMNISGYICPIVTEDLPEVFFMHFSYCWGWATWKDSWSLFQRNPKKLIQEFTKDDIYHFTLEGAVDYWQQVIANEGGQLYTWAVFWGASIFRNKGLTLAPRNSLTLNVGMDGTGEHCGETDLYHVKVNQNPIQKFPLEIQELPLARERHCLFFEKQKPSFFRRLARKGKNTIRKLL